MRIQLLQPGPGRPIGSSMIGAGVTLVLFGILVVVFPDLLALLFAGFTIFFGFALIGWGWRMRQIGRRSSTDDLPPWPPAE